MIRVHNIHRGHLPITVKEKGVQQSMSKVGCPYDNSPMEIHEGVCQYFDLLAELTDIQTDENEDLYLEKNINDIEGYMAFLDSFIGGALE